MPKTSWTPIAHCYDYEPHTEHTHTDGRCLGVLDHGRLCADDFELAHGYEPDMGDQVTTFAPGTCAVCRCYVIVFELDPAFCP